MRYNRTVIGYHGCDEKVARAVLKGTKKLVASENSYDWLGRGIYFWEHGPDRALSWAQMQAERDALKPPLHREAIKKAAVVGAIVHLGDCFDLLDEGNTAALAKWAAEYHERLREVGASIPQNRGREPLRALRDGDCAVINSFLKLRQNEGREHDSVRGCFLEGEPIFPNSGIYRLAHIQIAVRNPTCIVGVFRPIMEAP